jgi:hypothetical protein
MSVPKLWLPVGWYPWGLIVHQQWYLPSDSNTNVDIKFRHGTFYKQLEVKTNRTSLHLFPSLYRLFTSRRVGNLKRSFMGHVRGQHECIITKSATLLHNPADKTMRLEMHPIDIEYIQDENVNRQNKIIMNKITWKWQNLPFS